MEIPEHLILRIKEDKQIEMAACLEAEMTFLKSKLPDRKNADVVYAYPELLHTKEDLFLFAITFGSHLANLRSGINEVSTQVRDMFNSSFN